MHAACVRDAELPNKYKIIIVEEERLTHAAGARLSGKL